MAGSPGIAFPDRLADQEDVTLTSPLAGALLTKGAGDWVNLEAGPSGRLLTSMGPGAPLVWSVPPSPGVTDHGLLTGLADDDHPQYPLVTGRAGGQTLRGGTAAGESLTLSSTLHPTKGTISLGGAVFVDEVNGRLGVGGFPAARLSVPVAPTPTNQRGLVSLGSAPFDGVTSGFFVGSPNGTHIAINAVAGYTGNFLDLQLAGATRLRLTFDGNLSVPVGTISCPGSGGSTSERFGAGSLAAGGNSLAVGAGASAPSSSSTAIGRLAVAGDAAGSSNTVLGHNTTVSAGNLQNNTVLGQACSVTGGNNSLVAGCGATSAFTQCIVLGRLALSSAANQFVAGSSNSPMSNVFFGEGAVDVTPAPYTINGTGGSGTDITGAPLNLAGGRGTGTGLGGSVVLQTAPPGSSGTGLNALVNRLTIDTRGNIVPGTAALPLAATDGFQFVNTMPGTPSGVPTAYTGRVPMVFDTTALKLWVYTGGSWKQSAAFT